MSNKLKITKIELATKDGKKVELSLEEAKARDMHSDYRSASCDDVARAVDREMQYRAALLNLRAGMAEAKNTNIVDYIDAVLGAG